jgi:regulatory protein
MAQRPRSGRAKPQGPRPVTASYLRNSAMHYISSRSASTAMVRRTLERRALRRLEVRKLPAEVSELIDRTIASFVELGLLNDVSFATSRAASLARKGFSRRRIAQSLQVKGITGTLTTDAIDPDLDDLTLARRYARSKRLGPWRRAVDATPALIDKELRAMARGGFPLQIAKRVLSEEAEE